MVKKLREYKGVSLLELPTSYTIIDIETTGLSPEYDEIIELSAIKVRNNEIIDRFSSLIQPIGYEYEDEEYPDVVFHEFVSEFITELTGITNDMLSTAPPLKEMLPKYLDFIGDEILIGHNVNFDINFLYDYSMKILSKPLKNNFVDTMRIFRKVHPELSHHRLIDFASAYNVSFDCAHRSMADCETTFSCYVNMFSDIVHTGFDLSSIKKQQRLRASDISHDVEDIDINNPVYGKVFVFTGALENFTRSEAMQIVANHGGINGDNVTKKTNFLVLGNTDYCSNIKNGKSNKFVKAEKYKLSGNDIEIISENVFLDMINDYFKN